jgi:hypothetical protein
MKTIIKQALNMGGVLRLWAVPPSDVSLFGKALTILTDADMVDISVQQESASFGEQIKTSFSGGSYDVEITAVVPGDSEDIRLSIAAMERQSRYLVIYLDGNGNYKLAGSIETPLRFSAKTTTGTTAASLNHYAISFTGQQRDRAVFIDNPFL